MPGRNSELIRQWSILRRLASRRRTTIAQLAEETGKTQRTVRRDLDALQAAGFAIEEGQDQDGKYWRLPPHSSQQFRDREDGPTDMTLNVSDDYALRSWILSFGSGVRVLAPAPLVDWAQDELDSAPGLYPQGQTGGPDPSVQPILPFGTLGLPSA